MGQRRCQIHCQALATPIPILLDLFTTVDANSIPVTDKPDLMLTAPSTVTNFVDVIVQHDLAIDQGYMNMRNFLLA